MITRRLALAPILAAGLLLAAPAAAQSGDAVTDTIVATVDLCFRVLEGRASWESGLDSLGYQTVSSGGRVKPVGGAVVASTMGGNTVGGTQARICEITASPGLSSKAALNGALSARSRGLPAMGAGAIAGGGTMDGYADLRRSSGLIALAITDRPAGSGGRTTTSVSVIWK